MTHETQRAAQAGGLYFAIVFALGFAFGTVRVLVLESRVGAVAAVVLEMPLMLTACWFACAWIVKKLAVAAAPGPRLCMGGVAFALLIAAEAALSVVAFGRGPAEYVASFATVEGGIGLAGQVLFGVFPLLALWRERE